MIEKERLEELIKQCATVYCVDNNKVYDIALLNNSDNINTATKYGLFTQWREWNKSDPLGWWQTDSIFIKRLFETKEEAEWALEFGNITRTETLNLPSWEEIKKGCATFFLDANYLGFITPLDIIVINKYGNGGSESFIKTLLKTPLTKENYIEACRLAKKLFLGEK